jgi:peptidoglycan-N-acetylglucosamine deacetylase
VTKRVTLTFDNGPTPGVTEQVLDVLAAQAVRATFFVVGADLLAGGARELARRAVAEGHRIGNHTMNHLHQFGDVDDRTYAVGEIDAAQAVIGDLAGEERLFRPYGGGGVLSRRVLTQEAVSHLQEGGYTCVLWNSVPRDWERPDEWIEPCLRDVEQNDWTVVVVHDQATGAMRHLPRLLESLHEREIEIRQDFPDSCVPIRRGELVGSVADLIALPSGITTSA